MKFAPYICPICGKPRAHHDHTECRRIAKATRTNAVDGQSIEDSGRYWVACNGMEFETGDYESRALQPAGRITESSYRRISRLLGV